MSAGMWSNIIQRYSENDEVGHHCACGGYEENVWKPSQLSFNTRGSTHIWRVLVLQ